MINLILETVSRIVWGYGTTGLILLCGFIFTFSLRFLQIRKLPAVMSLPFTDEKHSNHGLSAFSAMTTALAGTMGVGNIVGVGAAIAVGGPGAVFWMWISAVFGMVTKYAEIVLSMRYRSRDRDNNPLGGPFSYMEKALKAKWLAAAFCVITVMASFGVGNAIQINALTESFNSAFGVSDLLCAVVTLIIASRIIFGGAKTIGKVTAVLTPFLSIIYVLGCIAIIFAQRGFLFSSLCSILKYAFTPMSAVGGFAGAGITAAMRVGVSHGVFSNEAGMGSSAIAHASSNLDDPKRQGLWGIFEVFIDTIVVCSLTAVAVLSSGVWTSGVSRATVTISAFETVFPYWGGKFIAVSVGLFAFATLLSWSFYGEKSMVYLFGGKYVKIYKTLYIAVAFFACFLSFTSLLHLCDIFNGLMVLPNVITLIILRRNVVEVGKL